MTGQDPFTDSQDNGAGEVQTPRILDDEIVALHLASLAEIAEAILTDVDQCSADLDDNHLAIGSSVAWLIGERGRELSEASAMLRSRLTFCAGQGMYPFR